MTQRPFIPALRSLHIGTLITLWVGATIANIATLLDVEVAFTGLAGGAILVGFLLLRLWQASGLGTPAVPAAAEAEATANDAA